MARAKASLLVPTRHFRDRWFERTSVQWAYEHQIRLAAAFEPLINGDIIVEEGKFVIRASHLVPKMKGHLIVVAAFNEGKWILITIMSCVEGVRNVNKRKKEKRKRARRNWKY